MRWLPFGPLEPQSALMVRGLWWWRDTASVGAAGAAAVVVTRVTIRYDCVWSLCETYPSGLIQAAWCRRDGRCCWQRCWY